MLDKPPPPSPIPPPALLCRQRFLASLIVCCAASFVHRSNSSFKPYDKVEGNWAGEGNWYLGTVAAVRRIGSRELYDIAYDDGDREQGIGPEMLRLPQGGVKSAIPPKPNLKGTCGRIVLLV